MRDAFLRTAAEYIQARNEALANHPLARFIRGDAAAAVREALPARYKPFLVQGSPGAGNWARVPWIAVFDPAVTESATRGYVYLFSADMQRVYLSLNQGTTHVREEFGLAYIDELERRVGLIRTRVPEYQGRFDAAPIDLATEGHLPRGYEAGHAFGRSYDLVALPDRDELAADLSHMLPLFAKLRARGGVLALQDGNDESVVDHRDTVTERRRYRLHRSVERDSSASKKAKKVHGYICQGCGFDFEAVYGAVGQDYIEAHHLTPLSELPEDTPVSLDPRTDFAVLCANCHRIMHRKDGPRSLEQLRTLSQVPQLQALLARLTVRAD